MPFLCFWCLPVARPGRRRRHRRRSSGSSRSSSTSRSARPVLILTRWLHWFPAPVPRSPDKKLSNFFFQAPVSFAMLSCIRGPRLYCSCLPDCLQFACLLLLHDCICSWLSFCFSRSRSGLKFMYAARAHCRLHLHYDKADAPSTSRPAAEEPVENPVPAPNPVTSPSSDKTTEAALEESAPLSPSPADTAPPASVALPAEGESASGASSPPPEAWAAIMSFLDRAQEARQSALASLPTSDLIRLTLEASATALGRLSWYEGTPVSVSGDPIRNPPPGRLVLRAAPVAKEPPPKATVPSPSQETTQVKEEVSDAAPVPPPNTSDAPQVAIPKTCPLPFPRRQRVLYPFLLPPSVPHPRQ